LAIAKEAQTMMFWINYAAWATAVAALVYIAGSAGVLDGNPLACGSLALIGLGLCKHALSQPEHA